MKTETGRYSGYIRPFSYLIDLIIINVLAIYCIPLQIHEIIYLVLISCIWFIIAANLGFYEVYRYTKVIAILNCSLKQGIVFTLFCLSFAFFYTEKFNAQKVVLFAFISMALILFIKLFVYYFLWIDTR